MSYNDKSKANLKKWKKGESGNPDGPNRKFVCEAITEWKAQGVKPLKPSQVIELSEYLLMLTIDELTAMVNDKASSVYIRVLGKGILSGKGLEVIEKMLDRAHGKAKQSVEVSGELNTINQTTVFCLKNKRVFKAFSLHRCCKVKI